MKINILIITGLLLSLILIPGVCAVTSDNIITNNITASSDITALIQYIDKAGGIPITVTTTAATNWTQFMISLFIGSFFLIFFFGQMISGGIDNTLVKATLKNIKRHTGRNVVFIKHTNASMFNQSMIDQKTATKLCAAMAKFEGKDFDLILHTPGGEVFSSLMISRILKQYPGRIKCIVPMYAMSGGTLLALSTDEIVMNETACLGPVDPQLGSLFKYGSAKSWEKIVKFKGKKADDSSISFALEGTKYTKTIRAHLMDTIDLGMAQKDKEAFVDFLTKGNVEHAYSLTPERLQEFGVPVKIMRNYKVIDKLIKIASKLAGEGVTYV